MTALAVASPAGGMFVRSEGGRRTRPLVAAAAAFLAVTTVGVLQPTSEGTDRAPVVAPVVDPGIPTGAAAVEVVVQARPGTSVTALTRTVEAAGGEVMRALPIVDGAEVRIAGDHVARLAEDDGIAAITLDRGVSFETVSYDEAGTASAFVGASGAQPAWSAGNLGQGVGVAVIDTGISEMNDFKGRLVHGPDLSGEGTLVDTYGHGTVMAGIIGGSGMDSAGRTGGAYTGIAPKTHLVAVKVAGANGAADVSTLLQAMHWVASYEDQFNIRVLNLSWGTPSTQDPAVDPLNYAAQRLWDQGIVVVTSAGNNGPHSGTIMKPGDDPKIITAGAFDDKGTASLSDDSLPSWTSQGPTKAGLTKPDIVASGRRVISPRSYGSTVEKENPKALISPSYIRGSGSSQAAAVTSGAAALLIAARPELTPDQVKHLLKSTAKPIGSSSANIQGAGRIDVAAALTAAPGAQYWQPTTATGLGSIDASRGGWYVQTDCGNDGTVETITGEIDVRCEPWSGSSWTGSSWTGSSWTGSSWTGSSWTGSSWTGSSWTGSSWTEQGWAGSSWTGSSWTGSSWTGSSWTGGTWSGSSWTGSSWTGSSWTGSSWTGSSWTGSSWTGSSWTGSSWTGSSWTSAVYEDDLFLTAWWGMNPPIGDFIPGEAYTLPAGTRIPL